MYFQHLQVALNQKEFQRISAAVKTKTFLGADNVEYVELPIARLSKVVADGAREHKNQSYDS